MTDEYAGLTARERARLERFAEAFEEVDPETYGQFAGTSASPTEIEAAREAALRSIGGGSRRQAVQAALAAFAEAGDRAMRERTFRPSMLFGGTTGLPSRPADRVRFLEALERAAVAAILWDDLTDAEREVLAGPWSEILGRTLSAG